eukprot:SAG11_NODE_27134_length_336_cov_0.907173_1_plen_107_part_10
MADGKTSATVYRVVKSADVREESSVQSAKTGILKKGEMVAVVETLTTNKGLQRVRIEKPCHGWTSIVSRKGEVLLQLVDKSTAAKTKGQTQRQATARRKSGKAQNDT